MNKTDTIECIKELGDYIDQLDAMITKLADFSRLGPLSKGSAYDVKGSSWFCITAEHMIDYLYKERKEAENGRKELIVSLWEKEQ